MEISKLLFAYVYGDSTERNLQYNLNKLNMEFKMIVKDRK